MTTSKPDDAKSPELPVIRRWREVLAAIQRATASAGRSEGSVDLVCVSKTYGCEDIEPLLACGAKVFGENRVQEAAAKWPILRRQYPGIELHLIGPLQTNKVREAVELFDVIETLDRMRLAEALAKEIDRTGKRPVLYVEINTGAEPQKAGVLPDNADAFLETCRNRLGLDITGLMCIPPHDEPPGPHFAMLADIARRNRIARLSMGMSADYAVAIANGASAVRVGSAIFGPRATA